MLFLRHWTTSLLTLPIAIGAVAAANYNNCSQFFTQPDGSPSGAGGDISSHLASKNCKVDASLMTLFNSHIGQNMFDALAMTKHESTSVHSCDAFVFLLSFAAMNNWLDELCATGSLNSPGREDERDYCGDAGTYGEKLGSAIQTLQAHPALKGLSDMSQIMKSFTENPRSCQMVCGSFVEAALCDGFVNTIAFVASKLRNGAEFTHIPSFDASAFDVLDVDHVSGESGSPAQRLFLFWWFLSNGYRPSQDSDKVDIETEYNRFVEWKKQQDAKPQTIATAVPVQLVDPQHVSKSDAAAASTRSGARRSSSSSKSYGLV